MDNLEWLREHMRNHISGSAPMEATKGVLRFRGAPAPATRDSGATLDLVYQAAEMVKGIEDRANEIGTYARSIAERASEKLQLAEKRIQELEAERRAADACISEARARIEDAEEALRLERSRVKAAEDQLGQLESRARAAELRADESENALTRIEDAIRTQLLRQGRAGSKKSAAAA